MVYRLRVQRTSIEQWFAIFLAACFALQPAATAVAQISGELNRWQLSLDKGESFRPVNVPGTVEDQVDIDFDGISFYRTRLPSIRLAPTQRLLLHFQAVATEATVYFDDQCVGKHLGGWTPFTIDLTDEIKAVNSGQPHDSWLRAEVDEKIGHNTQGFLPVVTNHFGGIWQSVTWEVANREVIVDDAIVVRPDFAGGQLVFETPVLTTQSDRLIMAYSIRPLRLGSGEPAGPWENLEIVSSAVTKSDHNHIGSIEDGDAEFVYSATIKSPANLQRWSPVSPQRYELRVRLNSIADNSDSTSTETLLDTVRLKMGFRSFDVEGDQFRLNQQPLAIRGLLNWGYAPPGVAPSIDESWMRNEILFAQARGFNMMKFCLWVPPKQYLELCDKLGMLAWMEYPTWHPQLDKKHLDELRQEYAEFYEHDRNHCSIVLRSLTCETGPGADIEVIKSLYQQCKQFIPGAILEDDSSWIQWNRVHDFYDDHPYGNNHTWVPTLASLKDYIAHHEQQPLALGESMAADTWTVPTEQTLQTTRQNSAHAPRSIADALRWQKEIGALAAKRNRSFDSTLLLPQSRHYGMLMRKYQIETFRREVSHGAYVVSVIRDFPKAAMGLLDYDNRPKTAPEDWAFQSDRMLILSTENDRRSFDSGSVATLSVILKNDAKGAVGKGKLRLDVVDDNRNIKPQTGLNTDSVTSGEFSIQKLDLRLPQVTNPTRFVLRAQWTANDVNQSNEWPLWVFPEPASNLPEFVIHPSAATIAGELPIRQHAWESASDSPSTDAFSETNRGSGVFWGNRRLNTNIFDKKTPDPLPILARHFDAELLTELADGRRVLMIPDGEAGSFPLSEHWFLRGGPVVMPRTGESWHRPFSFRHGARTESQNMLVELQHFDLAGPVVPNVDHYLALIDPSIVLWDNHDLSVVKTHGLVFEMSVGKGRMLVSSLNHTGQTNSAGRWLFDQFCHQLNIGGLPPGDEIRETTLHRLEAEVNRRAVLLHTTPWKFQPDPNEIGVTEKWFATDFDDSQWSEIRVDQHWESQGFEALDGWAWYRQSIKLPDDWDSKTTYLNFTGIDDYAVIYVNGTKLGTAGDLETRRTAFEDRLSFDISRVAKAGETVQITVAVYDWFGAGGIFRPVTLTTAPLSENPPILK